MVPALMLKVKAVVGAKRPAALSVPPSMVKTAPAPERNAFVFTVPTLNVPVVKRKSPLLVGLPFCPATV